MNLRKSLLVLCAFALGTSPAHAQWGDSTGSVNVNFSAGPYHAEKPYTVTASASYYEMPGYYPIGGGVSLYKNGAYVGGNTGYGSASVSYTSTEQTAGRVTFSATAYDDYGGSYSASRYVDVLASNKPQPSVSVDGYGSGSTVTRPYGGAATITVRFKATDPDANLTGIRPNVWRPDGSLDNNGGAYISQSGGSGEIVWTVSLNQNGAWRFWAEARDASGNDATSANWNSGFTINVNEAANRAPDSTTLTATRYEINEGDTVTLTGTLRDPDGNLAFHTIWWDCGGVQGWTNAQFEWDGRQPDSRGWSNISNTNGSISNGSTNTVTANWTGFAAGTYQFHTNGHDGSLWGPGATITIKAYPWVAFDEAGTEKLNYTEWTPTAGWYWEDQPVTTTAQTRTYQIKHRTGQRTVLGTERNIGSYLETKTETRSVNNTPRANPTMSLEILDAGKNVLPRQADCSVRVAPNATLYIRMTASCPAGLTMLYSRIDNGLGGQLAYDTYTVANNAPTASRDFGPYNVGPELGARKTWGHVTGVGAVGWDGVGQGKGWATQYNTSVLSNRCAFPLVVAELDTTPPTVPTALAASGVTSTRATISWTASTDVVGISNYEVFRDGALAGTSSTTTYSFTGLRGATKYVITVRAVDKAGNRSAQSSALSVTTPALAPNADEDGDGLPNQWEIDHGLDPYTPAQIDTNHAHTELRINHSDI